MLVLTMLVKIIHLLNSKQRLTCLFTALYFALATTSYAAQETQLTAITHANSPIVKDNFEWQVMLDLSLVSTPQILADVKQTETIDYVHLGILLDISYKGFFLQSNSRRSSTIIGSGEIGYQLSVQNDWELDLIIKTYIDGFDPKEIIRDQKQQIPQLEGLYERGFTEGIALRYSQFFDNSIAYVDLAAALTDKNKQGDYTSGIIIDSFYSYLIPYRNWDIYLGAGLTYYDKSLVDYYFGISADEVSNARALHDAKSAFRAQLEVYVQYPLYKSWSFNASLTQTFYSNSIKHSPLVDENKLTQLMVGVLYVF